MDTNYSDCTREETLDNSLVVLKRGQNIVKNRRGGRLAPTTVNSSVRTREYLTTAEIERLMAAARKSSRSGRNHDPDWLPPRLAGVRVVRSAMVAG
jgi:phosphate starvation-inducible protein PhoH